MTGEFSARQVTLDVLEHLERRRDALVDDEALVRAEVKEKLGEARKSYAEAELPASYFDALAAEVLDAVPARWLMLARGYTALEKRDFGLWRGGDVVSRVVYVFLGLLVGALCVEAPFIPIWEKWFPFALALAAWWLPNAQIALQRRRYARALGDLVAQMDAAQRQLDRHLDVNELLATPTDRPREKTLGDGSARVDEATAQASDAAAQTAHAASPQPPSATQQAPAAAQHDAPPRPHEAAEAVAAATASSRKEP